jgi:hypothetical protein
MWFFNKKKIDRKKIKQFDGAIKAVEIFIMLSEWKKARKALDEIKFKEKEILNKSLEKIDELDDKA